MGQRLSSSCLVLLLNCPAALVRAEDVLPAEAVAEPGRLLMLRHALAPGYGDPPEFRLGDCATQRNLDEAGRAQARALGDRLRAAGVESARVYSSQWCRCLETASLLKLGPVETLPALNSFYQRPEARERHLDELRRWLAAQPSNGPPLVLVTHQVTIRAITGAGTPSGGGSVFALNGSGSPTLLGRIAPD